MQYQVEVDWAPAYELVVSMDAFLRRQHQKTLELGPGWASRVRQRLGPAGEASLKGLEQRRPEFPLAVLVRACPGPRDAGSYLDWLAGLSPGELYEAAGPAAPGCRALTPEQLSALRDQFVHGLRTWNEAWFSSLDPAIGAGLAAEAGARREEVATSQPEEFVEKLSAGVVLEPGPELRRVILVPQHHFRPWNLFGGSAESMVVLYPADVLACPPGEPGPALLRLTRALADENRLRILHYLSGTPHSFTEIVAFAGLAKSTVHHHLVALRAAGLLRIHLGADQSSTYSLRPGIADDAAARLGAFLKGAL